MKRKTTTKQYQPPVEHLSMVEEAAVSYDAPEKSVFKVVSDPFQQIAQARKGLPKEALFEVAEMYGVTLDVLSSWLMASYRNLQRKEENALLDSYKSEKLIQLMELAQQGKDTLGSAEAFKSWVKAPLLALGNQKPSQFLDTSFGINMISNLLGRLAWGVYS